MCGGDLEEISRKDAHHAAHHAAMLILVYVSCKVTQLRVVPSFCGVSSSLVAVGMVRTHHGFQGYSRVMRRPAGRVRKVFKISRVGSGRAGPGGVGSGGVGSGREAFKLSRVGWERGTRPDLVREV